MFEDGKCTLCGHDFDQHMGPGATTHGPFTCPPLPPAKSKQVTVDEAVVAKGGKPGFVAELDAATVLPMPSFATCRKRPCCATAASAGCAVRRLDARGIGRSAIASWRARTPRCPVRSSRCRCASRLSPRSWPSPRT